jgi:hypothetical protein
MMTALKTCLAVSILSATSLTFAQADATRAGPRITTFAPIQSALVEALPPPPASVQTVEQFLSQNNGKQFVFGTCAKDLLYPSAACGAGYPAGYIAVRMTISSTYGIKFEAVQQLYGVGTSGVTVVQYGPLSLIDGSGKGSFYGSLPIDYAAAGSGAFVSYSRVVVKLERNTVSNQLALGFTVTLGDVSYVLGFQTAPITNLAGPVPLNWVSTPFGTAGMISSPWQPGASGSGEGSPGTGDGAGQD